MSPTSPIRFPVDRQNPRRLGIRVLRREERQFSINRSRTGGSKWLIFSSFTSSHPTAPLASIATTPGDPRPQSLVASESCRVPQSLSGCGVHRTIRRCSERTPWHSRILTTGRKSRPPHRVNKKNAEAAAKALTSIFKSTEKRESAKEQIFLFSRAEWALLLKPSVLLPIRKPSHRHQHSAASEDTAADVALWGRMLAAAPKYNREAAVSDDAQNCR